MSARVQAVGCATWRAKWPIFGLKKGQHRDVRGNVADVRGNVATFGQRRDVTERVEANVATLQRVGLNDVVTFGVTSRRYRELD